MARRDQLGRPHVLFHVVVQDRVEHRVVRQRIGVELSGGEFRARRLGDRVLRDGRRLAALHRLRVAPPGQLPDQRLGHVLDGPEAACGVTVEGGVPGGDLALVPGGQDEMSRGVAQPHQDHAPDPGLEVLRGQALQVEFGLERVNHGRDRDRAGVQPLPFGQFLRIAHRMLRGVPAGHEHHMDRIRPERIGGDRGDQRGIDPPGQAQDDRAETVLAHVVPHPGDQRGVDLGPGGQPGRDERLSERGRRDRRRGPRGQCDPVNAHQGAVAGLDGRIGRR